MSCGDFGRREVETEAVRSRVEMDERLEMGLAYRPCGCWKIVLMVAYRHSAVDRLFFGLTNQAMNQQDLLMDPRIF